MTPSLEQEQEYYEENKYNVLRRSHSQSAIFVKMNSESRENKSTMPKGGHVSKLNRLLPRRRNRDVIDTEESLQKDEETVKEKFTKLLLGEDMSGEGNGVSSALALSNSITNLAASLFGELRKLEPMSPENKARWKREIDWLLSVTDYIVELVPIRQTCHNGTTIEVMTTKQRTDLEINIPALRKLDAMLIDCLDNFKGQNEFFYVSSIDGEGLENISGNREDKWWVPSVKVQPSGLSELTRKWVLFHKDSATRVLKAAMAINEQVLSEMEVPETYIDSLPKNGRATLGDAIYKCITHDHFDPDQFFCAIDLSSEHKIVDLKSKIEASILIWRRKMVSKDIKAPWGSAVSLEKRELFEERATTILQLLKQRYPRISQSSLDISKIEFNQDVGHAVLESYSRVLESIAHKVLSCIEDVLHADSLTKSPNFTRSI